MEREIVEERDLEVTEAYEQYNPMFHENKHTKYLTLKFLKKYIAFAKQQYKPILMPEVADFISEKWTFLRQKESQLQKLVKILPISIRSLESMIRLSTAFAKLRLSNKVEMRDAIAALQIFTKAFYSGYSYIDANFFSSYEELLMLGRSVQQKKLQNNLSQRNKKSKMQ